MTTYYATAATTNWSDGGDALTTGWALTSGGSSTLAAPQGGDNVIFDANSGPARTITFSSNVPIASLSTVGSNGMVFATGGSFTLTVSGNVDLTSTVSVNRLTVSGASANNFTPAACTVNSLILSSTGGTTLLSNLTITNTMTMAVNGVFNANGFNITTPTFSTSGTGTLTMGSGTWTISGSTGNVFNINTSTTIVPGTSTVKLTDTTSSGKSFSGGGRTFANFWNATTGGGVVTVSGFNTFSNFKVDPATITKLPNGGTTTVASLTVDGTSSQIFLSSSSSGNSATLAKSGGGTIYIDRCTLQDIAASPAATFFARNSVNTSGNTNWTFIGGNSGFAAFF